MTEEKTHYSREELEEFKQIIIQKLEEARIEYKSLQDSYQNAIENVKSGGFNLTEYSSEHSDKEQSELLLQRTAKFINALERALVRIENGTYGRCKVTGKLIPKERLRIVPHTESLVEVKNSR